MHARGPALVVEENALVALFLDEQLALLGFGPVSVLAPRALVALPAMPPPSLAIISIGMEAAATISMALALRAQGVPLILVNGGSLALHELPASLRQVPILAKPFGPRELDRAIGRVAR